MERKIYVRPQLDIRCRFGFGESQPDLLVDSDALPSAEDGAKELTVEVEPPIENAPEPEVRLVFFNAEDSDFRIFVWTRRDDGTIEAWDWSEPGYCQQPFASSDAPIVVQIALLKADEPPPAAPPAPGTSSTLVRVTVRKKGAMPLIVGGP